MSNSVLKAMFPDMDVEGIEGEFVSDPDPWKPEEYDGELRYVNCGPQKIASLLETETDPVERAAILAARDWWGRNQPPSIGDAGEPYRGEQREDIRVSSIRDLVDGDRDAFIKPMGSLATGGIPRGAKGTDYVFSLFDFDMLGGVECGLPPIDEMEDNDFF